MEQQPLTPAEKKAKIVALKKERADNAIVGSTAEGELKTHLEAAQKIGAVHGFDDFEERKKEIAETEAFRSNEPEKAESVTSSQDGIDGAGTTPDKNISEPITLDVSSPKNNEDFKYRELYLKSCRENYSKELNKLKNEKRSLWDKVGGKKIDDTNLLAEKSLYNDARQKLLALQIKDKEEELRGEGKTKDQIKAEMIIFREKSLDSLRAREQKLLNESRFQELSDRKKSLLKKTLNATLGAAGWGFDKYKKLGDWGPGISFGGSKKLSVFWSRKDPSADDAIYSLTAGKVARSLGLGLLSGGMNFGGELAAKGSRIVARSVFLGLASGSGLYAVKQVYKGDIDSLNEDSRLLKDKYSKGEINFSDFELLEEKINEKKKKAERKQRLLQLGVTALTVGLGYGFSQAEHAMENGGASLGNSGARGAAKGLLHRDHQDINSEKNIEPSKGSTDSVKVDGNKSSDTAVAKTETFKPSASVQNPDSIKSTDVSASKSSLTEQAETKVISENNSVTKTTTESIKSESASVQTTTPAHSPEKIEIPKDAVIGKGAVSITQAFKNQLEHDQDLADKLGYPSDGTAHEKAVFLGTLAKKLGYIGEHGESIGVQAGMGEAYVLTAVEHDGTFEAMSHEYQNGELVEEHASGDSFENNEHNKYEYIHHANVSAEHDTPNADETAEHANADNVDHTHDHDHDVAKDQPVAPVHKPEPVSGSGTGNIEPHSAGHDSLKTAETPQAKPEVQKTQVEKAHENPVNDSGGVYNQHENINDLFKDLDTDNHTPEVPVAPSLTLSAVEGSEGFVSEMKKEMLDIVGYTRGAFGNKIINWDRWMMIKHMKMSDIMDKHQHFPWKLRHAVKTLRALGRNNEFSNGSGRVEEFVKLSALEHLKNPK